MFSLTIVSGAASSVVVRTGTARVLRRFATTSADAAYRISGDGAKAILPAWRRFWREGLI